MRCVLVMDSSYANQLDGLTPIISASDVGQNIVIARKEWFSTVTQIGSLLIHLPSLAAVLPCPI